MVARCMNIFNPIFDEQSLDVSFFWRGGVKTRHLLSAILFAAILWRNVKTWSKHCQRKKIHISKRELQEQKILLNFNGSVIKFTLDINHIHSGKYCFTMRITFTMYIVAGILCISFAWMLLWYEFMSLPILEGRASHFVDKWCACTLDKDCMWSFSDGVL